MRMHLGYRTALIAAAGTVLLVSALVTNQTVIASDDPCPGEGHVSTGTGEDRGFPKGAKICPKDQGQNTLYGGCDFNPYQILETQFKSGGQITPASDSGSTLRSGIDPVLACRLVKLFQAAQQRGCQAKITSGYRSYGQQEQMCGRGRSGCAPAAVC